MLFELAQRSFFLFCKVNKKNQSVFTKQGTLLKVSCLFLKSFVDKKALEGSPAKAR